MKPTKAGLYWAYKNLGINQKHFDLIVVVKGEAPFLEITRVFDLSPSKQGYDLMLVHNAAEFVFGPEIIQPEIPNTQNDTTQSN